MLSQHAQQRVQQRAIPYSVIEILLDHGVIEHRKCGLEILYLNKQAKRAALTQMRAAGLKHTDHYLNAYVLESNDGTIADSSLKCNA